MAFEFKLPDLGEGLTEGEIVKWLVKAGDPIEEGQVFVQVETDKAVIEIPSPKKGVVLKLGAAEGDTVQVGSVIIVIGEKGEKIPAAVPNPRRRSRVPRSALSASWKRRPRKKRPKRPRPLRKSRRCQRGLFWRFPWCADWPRIWVWISRP